MKYEDRIKLMNELMKESETVVTTISDSNTEEIFNVMTDEGFVSQLNRLFSKGSIDKEYYIKQVGILKNNYTTTYELIKEKLLWANE